MPARNRNAEGAEHDVEGHEDSRHGKDRPSGSAIGVTIGAVIMVVGYSLGRAFIYSTPEYALLKLPFQIAQAVVGAVVGWLLCWKCKIAELYEKRFGIMS